MEEPTRSDLGTGRDVDRLLTWPAGRAERLARRKKLPHYRLPDGAVRFRLAEILPLVKPGGPLPCSGVLLQDQAETGRP